jgi:hypothetical protein
VFAPFRHLGENEQRGLFPGNGRSHAQALDGARIHDHGQVSLPAEDGYLGGKSRRGTDGDRIRTQNFGQVDASLGAPVTKDLAHGAPVLYHRPCPVLAACSR